MFSLFSFQLLGLKGLAGEFLCALSLLHYVFVICTFQVIGGFFVILIRFVGLGLAVSATIIVNIQFFCFHDHLLRERPCPCQQKRLRLIVASRGLSNSFLPTNPG